MMSSEASWMGFFMYPTFSSRSCAWAKKRPAERTRPIAVAKQNRMSFRSSRIDTSLSRAELLLRAAHRPARIQKAEANLSPLSSALGCNSSPERRIIQERADAKGGGGDIHDPPFPQGGFSNSGSSI